MTWKSSCRGVIGLIVLGLCAGASRAAEADLSAAIGKLVGASGGMRVGVRIEAIGPRPAVIFDQDSDELFKPASNQKLVTTAAAMCVLPENFAYRTVLAVRGDDLVIIGAGDPSCGDPRMAQVAKEPITALFHEWADRLKAAGLVNIRGDLLFDDSIFDDEFVLKNWEKQFNLLEWYCAPVGGLNFNDNCIDVVMRPSRDGIGQPAEVTLIPGTSWITLDNKAKTAEKGEPIVKRLGQGPLTISVTGSVSKPNSPESPLSISINDPGMFFASACRTALAAQGIAIQGETRRARVRSAAGGLPPEVKTVAVHERPMSDVLWRVNKSSMNMFAEALLKTMGAYTGRESAPGQGSYETGRAVVKRFLAGLGIPEDIYVLDDGSGLSHENRVTPAMLVKLLKHMNSHPRRKEWWSNLAVPGERFGTLRTRMKDLAGQVFAKTGSIRGVSSLSGYVVGKNNQIYVFSILCNDTHKAKQSPRTLQDGICRTLAEWGGKE